MVHNYTNCLSDIAFTSGSTPYILQLYEVTGVLPEAGIYGRDK